VTRALRVLVVDDSVVVRRLVADALASDPGIEVIGTAANGRIALSKLTQLQPDAVTLDIEMPELDGLGTLRELRKTHPKLPVVMFSTLTERGAAATLDALSLGANDYVTKPSNTGSVTASLERIREELVPKLKALCPGLGVVLGAGRAAAGPIARVTTPAAPRPPAVRRTPDGPPARVDLVAIGVSTGGPNALADLVPALPAALPVPVVIVQHMPPVFTRLLAERLDARSGLRVAEATEGAVLQPGTVWIAPGDSHMLVQRRGASRVLHLDDGPQENSCRPAVDPLFRSAVASYGAGVLGVVMTGMGQDGLRGAEVVVDAGGRVLTQDEESSVVWGMPGFVTNAGLADKVLPLADLPHEIARRLAAGRAPLEAGVR
jgi:two-component system chemotaxis response regulator CheB